MRRGWSWARWRAGCLLACGAGSCRAGFGRGSMPLWPGRQFGRQAGASPHLFALSSFAFSLSSPLDVLAFSCWLCMFDLGGQAGGIRAAGGGVSVWPWRWACRALLRHGAGLAALVPCLLSVSPAGRAGAVCAGAGHGQQSQANRLANRQNAQRFNRKCSIMTKIMPCISCFLRCKYACFGVK